MNIGLNSGSSTNFKKQSLLDLMDEKHLLLKDTVCLMKSPNKYKIQLYVVSKKSTSRYSNAIFAIEM